MTRRRSLSNTEFAVLCAVAYAIVVLATPSYTPLIEVDSGMYIDFSPFRPAFYPSFLWLMRMAGLSPVGVTWVQTGIFAVALGYAVTVFLRNGFPRWMVAGLVAVLAGNILYSSFHRSILTESLTFSCGIVAVALWVDYIRNPRLGTLAGAGIALGAMLGLRLAGLGIVPVHILLVLVRRPQNVSLIVAVLVAALPVGGMMAAERALHYAIHGGGHASQAPNLLTLKAAMLIEPGMTFTGPHAKTLERLGAKLTATFLPMRDIVDKAPSLPVALYLSAFYEGAAAYDVMAKDFEDAAKEEGTTPGALRSALGWQVIRQNIPGFLKLTFMNDIGQWSIALPRFPANARVIKAYADATPGVSFDGRVTPQLLNPQGSTMGLVVYPAFYAAGLLMLALAAMFLVFLARPSLANQWASPYLVTAAYFGAMCHAYTLFISLVDDWTPRFLMSVFPQIAVAVLCLILAAISRGNERTSL